MSPATVAWQVTILGAAGLLGVWMLRNRSAALRHLVLLTSLLSAVLVPVVTTLAPSSIALRPHAGPAVIVAADMFVATPTVPHPGQPAGADQDATPMATHQWLLILWTSGTVIGLLRLLREARTLSHLRRRSPLFSDERWLRRLEESCDRLAPRPRVGLREARVAMPVLSWGWRRPQILVPATARTWDDAQVQSVLCHELAHIARRDWVRFVAMECIRCVYWWHPLVWIAVRDARLLAERACDDVVLDQQRAPTLYAEHLVTLARLTATSRSSIVTATTYTSYLERRIAAMLNPHVDRTPVRSLTRCLVIGSLLLLSSLTTGAFVRADARDGTLVATVRPDGGQPLGDVEVVITGAGGAAIRARTDATGSFSATLPPGSYLATVRVPGFRRYEAHVEMVAGDRVTRDFALTLGALVEQVDVAGETDPQAVPVELTPNMPFVSQVGVVSIPRRVDDKKAPAYPAALREAGIQGIVKAAGRVGPDGHVSDVKVLESPHDGLSAIVTQYMTTMRYEPTKIQGTPVATDLVLTIRFQTQP